MMGGGMPMMGGGPMMMGGPMATQQKKETKAPKVSKKGVKLTKGEKTVSGKDMSSKKPGENVVQASNSELYMNDVTITKTGDGIASDATTPSGSNAAVLALDGGKIVIRNSQAESLAANAQPFVALGGTLRADSCTATANSSTVGVVDGGGDMSLNNCHLHTDNLDRGFLLVESGNATTMPGGGSQNHLDITGGTVHVSAPTAPLVEVTSTAQAAIRLNSVSLHVASGELMRVCYDHQWRGNSPSASLELLSNDGEWHTYAGDIIADEYGTAKVTVDKFVTWNGALNSSDEAKQTSAVINGTWNLTSDSHVNTLVVGKRGHVKTNGHQLTYDTLENKGHIE